MKRLGALVLLHASIAIASPSRTAKPHVDAGVQAYNSADYKTAIAEFEIAYGIDADPVILYAWAQAHRLAGNCDKALELYRRYLETKPTETQIAAAKTGMQLCVTRAPPPQTTSEPDLPRSESPQLEPEQPPAARSPWYKDALGGGLVIGGVASAAIGTTFLIMSNRSADAATDAPTRDEFLEHLDAATRRRRIGIVGVGLGSALVVAGVVRYITRRDEPSGRVGVTTSGSAIVVFGRF